MPDKRTNELTSDQQRDSCPTHALCLCTCHIDLSRRARVRLKSVYTCMANNCWNMAITFYASHSHMFDHLISYMKVLVYLHAPMRGALYSFNGRISPWTFCYPPPPPIQENVARASNTTLHIVHVWTEPVCYGIDEGQVKVKCFNLAMANKFH